MPAQGTGIEYELVDVPSSGIGQQQWAAPLMRKNVLNDLKAKIWEAKLAEEISPPQCPLSLALILKFLEA